MFKTGGQGVQHSKRQQCVEIEEGVEAMQQAVNHELQKQKKFLSKRNLESTGSEGTHLLQLQRRVEEAFHFAFLHGILLLFGLCINTFVEFAAKIRKEGEIWRAEREHDARNNAKNAQSLHTSKSTHPITHTHTQGWPMLAGHSRATPTILWHPKNFIDSKFNDQWPRLKRLSEEDLNRG